MLWTLWLGRKGSDRRAIVVIDLQGGSMCDYSLMEFPNRLAVDGELLVVHRFRSGSLGLTSPVDCYGTGTRKGRKRTFWDTVKELFFLPEPPATPAVCIPPGARLALHDVPAALQKQFGVGAEEEVTFLQTSAMENRHRDAVRFRTGHTLRLQELTVGQRVQVIDLGNSLEEEPITLYEDSARFSGAA